MRVAIIGGGIIGCLTACFLKQRGAEPVIVERGRMGQEASWAGAGILCPIQPWEYPDDFSHLVGRSLAMYPNLNQILLDETGMSMEWLVSGMLIPEFAGDAVNHRQAALSWSQRFDWRVRELDAAEAMQEEPALNQDILQGGVLWPDVAQLRNPRLLHAVHMWMQKLGIHYHEGLEVDAVLQRGGQVSGIHCRNGFELEADAVLLAGGSWSGELAASIGFELPVQPVKGQIVLVKSEPGHLRHIIKHDDAYFVPRADGRILVGASMEFVGFERGTTEETLQQLMAALQRMVPGIADAPVEHAWMGFRPGSPDGLPFIGPVPQLPGLWVASGHYRNGVALAPITAKVLSQWLVQGEPGFDMSAFAVNRKVKPSAKLGFPAG